MRCPKCGTELSEISIPIEDTSRPGHQEVALEIDQCPDCDGIWFDPGELDSFFLSKAKAMKVPKSTPKSAAELDRAGGNCPRCSVAMEQAPGKYNPSVMLDHCRKCGGTWVDGDEIERAGGAGVSFGDRMKAMFGDVRAGGR
jgi:Zn-finger nucleic acid-binding protein